MESALHVAGNACADTDPVDQRRAQLRPLEAVDTVARHTGEPLAARAPAAPGNRRRVPAHLERILVVLDGLNEQIAAADAELKRLAADDERTRRLMRVPGVGPVTAVRFVAAVDRIERFPTAARLASYLGLIPGERTRVPHQADASHPRERPAGALGPRPGGVVPLSLPARGSAGVLGETGGDASGTQIAITALARKLAHVLYALWKHATVYDPMHTVTAAA